MGKKGGKGKPKGRAGQKQKAQKQGNHAQNFARSSNQLLDDTGAWLPP